MSDKNHIFENVTVLNKCTTESDHRMLRPTIQIHLGKERYNMARKATKQTWTMNLLEFQKHNIITSNIGNLHPENNIDSLNKTIVEALQKSQKTKLPNQPKICCRKEVSREQARSAQGMI